jgi:mRNA-degrading endonuclease toxin of MazEF toxin-antitoxin module
MRQPRYRRGEVLLALVPLADAPGRKLRPVVVVSSDAFHRSKPANLLAARISANVSAHQTVTDYRLQDWQAAGLNRPSVVTSFLLTVAPSEVQSTLGYLSDRDLAEVDARLRLALDLP